VRDRRAASGGGIMLAAALTVFLSHGAAQNTKATLTTLYSFNLAAGSGYPGDDVVIGSGGVLYGVTADGGTGGFGTAFALTPPAAPDGAWTELVLHNFAGGSDGKSPGGLTIGDAGVLYGTTYYGGNSGCSTDGAPGGCGTVFSLAPPASPGGIWTYTVLYRFTGGTDGSAPQARLAIDASGVLYGVSSAVSYLPIVFALSPPSSPGGGVVRADDLSIHARR